MWLLVAYAAKESQVIVLIGAGCFNQEETKFKATLPTTSIIVFISCVKPSNTTYLCALSVLSKSLSSHKFPLTGGLKIKLGLHTADRCGVTACSTSISDITGPCFAFWNLNNFINTRPLLLSATLSSYNGL
jgi:hypothetical protein